MYVNPLTESQPLAPMMRQEFIPEIEQAKPKYVVIVTTITSWCNALIPGETQRYIEEIQTWWRSYSAGYQAVGAVDLSKDGTAEFFWEDQLARRKKTGPPEALVFVRK